MILFKFNSINNISSMHRNVAVLLCTFLLAIHSLMAITIQKYEIAPLNRLTLKFDILPENIVSSISDNKKMLSINLGNVNFTDEKKQLNSDGIIKQVNLSKDKEQTTLSLSLLEQRGYTIAKLPFTKTIIIDVFDWNKLDSVEDSYRLGLLSYIDNDYELAKQDLIKATNGNNAEAATFLGLINLEEGKIASALNCFKFAELKGSTIADNFAALELIYSLKNDKDSAEHYAKIYKVQTKEREVPTIILNPELELNDVLPPEMAYIDSVIKSIKISVDTAKTTLTDTIKSDTTLLDTNKTESIWAAENYLLMKYVVGIAVALVLLVIYLYLKWRNKQLLSMKSTQETEAAKPKSTPAKAVQHPVPTTKKAEFADVMNNQINANANKPAPAKKQPQLENKNIKQDVNYKKNAEELLNLIDNMRSEDTIKSESVIKAELRKANLDAGRVAYSIQANKSSSTKKRSANIELADRLANEQKKIKSEKLSKIEDTSKLDTSKVNEIAQRLGLEKGSIETKKNLENLSSNEDEFTKLSEKFGIKK